MTSRLLKVSLVGLPNVGKSTLFNRLTRTRNALVSGEPGVTRDRQIGLVKIEDKQLLLYDTGGIAGEENAFSFMVRDQADQAIADSDLILLVVDAQNGLMPLENELTAWLRSLNKQIWLVINKIDRAQASTALAEFSSLAIPKFFAISATHRRGLPDFCQALYDESKEFSDSAPALPAGARVTFIGRPNVGKSTLVNKLLGEERMLVSGEAGTTRDSIAIPFHSQAGDFVLVDTAGVRRQKNTKAGIEKISILKTFESVTMSDVAILVCDATEGITKQDAKLASRVFSSGCGLLIALNKSDILSDRAMEKMRRTEDLTLNFLSNVDRCVVSALKDEGLEEMLRLTKRCYDSMEINITTNKCNKMLEDAVASCQPPRVGGFRARLRYAHQGGSRPPRFIVHGSRVEKLPGAYKRYLANYFMRELALTGSPVILEFRSTHNPYAGKNAK